MKFYEFMTVYSLMVMLLVIVAVSTGCDNEQTVRIEVPDPIINNTYITNEYITKEYYNTYTTEVTEIIYRETGASIVALVHPCGLVGNNKEVFLELSSGHIIALYDGGAKLDRLVVIANGNYVTTHGSPTCSFTVNGSNVTPSTKTLLGGI